MGWPQNTCVVVYQLFSKYIGVVCCQCKESIDALMRRLDDHRFSLSDDQENLMSTLHADADRWRAEW